MPDIKLLAYPQKPQLVTLQHLQFKSILNSTKALKTKNQNPSQQLQETQNL